MSVFGRTYGRYAGGTVLKDGKEIRTKTVPEAIEHGIAYVTEDRKHYGLNLIDTSTATSRSAALGKVAKRGVVDEHEERQVAEGFRKSMNIKAPTVFEPVGKLSGGNQQKVVLSKWIFADPDVLILDEPTRGIDVGAKYEIYTVIDKLAAQGKAVVFISSELPELLGMCDRIYTMAAGRLTGEVSRAEATQEVADASDDEGQRGKPMSTDVTAKTPAPAPPGKSGTASGGGLLQLVLDGLRRNMRQYGMLIALGLIVVLFQVWTDGDLLLPRNVTNLVQQNSYILILAIGMMIVIIAGHIDLSVGSLTAFVGAMSAVLMVKQRHAVAAGRRAVSAHRRRRRCRGKGS